MAHGRRTVGGPADAARRVARPAWPRGGPGASGYPGPVEQHQPPPPAAPGEDPGHPDDATAPSLPRAIAVYTAIRLGIMVVITVGLMWVMPLIVALAFAVVLQLPLALLLFPRQRHHLTAALARAKSARTAERDRLRAALTGERPAEP